MVAHLKRGSADCLAAYLDHVPPLDSTYSQKLTKEDALIRRKRKDMGLTDLSCSFAGGKNLGTQAATSPS